MKNYFLLLLAIAFTLPQLKAQNYKTSKHEFGFGLGVANYLGDLAHTNDVPFFGDVQAKAFRPAVGLFYRHNFHRFLNFRANLSFGQLYGNDNLSKPNDGFDYSDRNLHFKSNITSISLLLEWNILPFEIGHYKYRFTPYIAAGIGGFYFNPKAELDGRWVALQPLGTEGQGLLEYPNRTKYSRMSFNFPIAVGLKFNLNRNWAIGAEVMYHYTFTDYIDDVSTVYPEFQNFYSNNVQAVADEASALSYRGDEALRESAPNTQRGNSAVNDHYFFVMISASMKIGKGRSSCNSFKR